jgi:hypothetical protein
MQRYDTKYWNDASDTIVSELSSDDRHNPENNTPIGYASRVQLVVYEFGQHSGLDRFRASLERQAVWLNDKLKHVLVNKCGVVKAEAESIEASLRVNQAEFDNYRPRITAFEKIYAEVGRTPFLGKDSLGAAAYVPLRHILDQSKATCDSIKKLITSQARPKVDLEAKLKELRQDTHNFTVRIKR